MLGKNGNCGFQYFLWDRKTELTVTLFKKKQSDLICNVLKIHRIPVENCMLTII